MKKIGFVDYYISEWHANNYPKWMEDICKEKGLDYKVCYAYAEKDVSDVDGKTTDEWCKEYGIEKCATIDELCEKSDYIVVLAPSNPETHLRLAQGVLKHKKTTYIDKTFAPDYLTAKKIFDIANEHGTKFFSTSALRFADEIADVNGDATTLTVLGNGASFDEYGIHVVEMTVKCMGIGAKKIRVEKSCDQIVVKVKYSDGRIANIFFDEHYQTPFTVIPAKNDGKSEYKKIESSFFNNLMTAILNFFETNEAPFDTNETLEVMKVRDAIIKGIARQNKWIRV